MGYSYSLYYAEAHIACIIVLLVILHRLIKAIDKQSSQIILANMIVSTVFYFGAEIFWVLVDADIILKTSYNVYLSNVITYILIGTSSFLWFMYTENLQNNRHIMTMKAQFLIALPAIIMSLLIIFAYKTNYVFYVDENGSLQNGNFYLVLILVPFGYMIASSLRAFYRASRKDLYADREVYISIGLFPIFPMLLGVFQAIFWRIPLLCYGATIAILYVYLASVENMISLDPLTQLNNRTQLRKYLLNKLKNLDPSLMLFVVIVDIDKLSSINEQYGRIEGDNAIIRVSDAVKDACSSQRNRFFCSRYNGDEFIIVAEVEYKAEVNWLVDQIKANVKRANANSGVDYSLTVSTGIAQHFDNEPITAETLVARAENELGHQKKSIL
ncbi:MAG: GGDEF domain-containing protein [Butyrivibrio sp.]|nr:GGDEF domain-containing protein [Butyrivibrio sp.]